MAAAVHIALLAQLCKLPCCVGTVVSAQDGGACRFCVVPRCTLFVLLCCCSKSRQDV
jgi:hypothetical protein